MMRMMVMMKIKSKLFEMFILENKSHIALYRSPFMAPNLIHTSSDLLATLEKRSKFVGHNGYRLFGLPSLLQ